MSASIACCMTGAVVGLLTLSMFLGLLMMIFSLLFYIFSFSFLTEAFKHEKNYRETVVYLQASYIQLLGLACVETPAWACNQGP